MNKALISEFTNLGCPSRKEAFVALQVYLELCEVKKYFDVEYHYHKDLKCMYITGRKTKSSDISNFVPISTSDRISFDRMQEYVCLSTLDQKSVILAMVNDDSTCVYYQITDGILGPFPETPPINIAEKRAKLDVQLHRNKQLIEQSALFGMPITINKENKRKKDKNKSTDDDKE